MKIKHLLSIGMVATLSFASSFTFAQKTHGRNCGTVEYTKWMEQNNPEYAKSRKELENRMQEWIKNNPDNSSRVMANDTIPVVVHVVYRTAAQNISDAQVQSQIDVLNEDWGRTNADAVNTPAVWQSISGSVTHRWKLACVDPVGNPTNGIRRVSTTVTAFGTSNSIKFTAQGGDDQWDPSRYFNIWVGNIGGGIIGYAEFPGATTTNTFGYVNQPEYFGRVGTATAPYNLGRTATHEIGHCFNLYHIWGDDGGACTGSDLCADTPNQGDATYGAPTFPLTTDPCSPGSPGIMFMNFMDYSDDVVLNMYTQNQVSRINATLAVSPYNALLTSTTNSCGPLAANDAGVSAVITPSSGSCTGTITPVVTLKNFGSATLVSADIYYKVDATAPVVYHWAGSLASTATTNVTLPAFTIGNGAHTFTSYSAIPNTAADPNHFNDTTAVPFSVLGAGSAIPLIEGFESGTFPPTNWTINNPDASYTWKDTTVFHSGAKSMFVDNYDYAANGQVDDMVAPAVNLTSSANPEVTFYVAYKMYTNPIQFSDTLRVLISTDCGASFTQIYNKAGLTLASGVAPFYTTAYYKPIASDWRKETIDLTPYGSAASAILKWRNITDYENNLWIDDINIDFATGIKTPAQQDGISIYPNPTNGAVFISNEFKDIRNMNVKVTDILGHEVMSIPMNLSMHQAYKLDLSGFSNGVYFITINTESSSSTTKIVLNK